MRRRLRCAVDVDGVTGDLHSVMGDCFADLYDQPMPTLTEWDITPVLPDGDWKRFWSHLGSRPVHDLLTPYPGAVEGIRMLQEVADVHIVTSGLRACRTWTADREDWLASVFGIERSNVTHTDAKYAFAADMLIDDKPSHVESWAAEHPGIPILFSQSYNRLEHIERDDIRARVVRTDSWVEIAGLLKERVAA